MLFVSTLVWEQSQLDYSLIGQEPALLCNAGLCILPYRDSLQVVTFLQRDKENLEAINITLKFKVLRDPRTPDTRRFIQY